MRIGLIGDTHGYVPALEAAIAGCRHAGVDPLILCGHVPYPLVQRTPLPNGRTALVVRGVGWMRGQPDGSGWTVDYWILENVGPAALAFRGWALHRQLRPFRPRDPNWTDAALRSGRVP